jgi:hypothetical protein
LDVRPDAQAVMTRSVKRLSRALMKKACLMVPTFPPGTSGAGVKESSSLAFLGVGCVPHPRQIYLRMGCGLI